MFLLTAERRICPVEHAWETVNKLAPDEDATSASGADYRRLTQQLKAVGEQAATATPLFGSSPDPGSGALHCGASALAFGYSCHLQLRLAKIIAAHCPQHETFGRMQMCLIVSSQMFEYTGFLPASILKGQTYCFLQQGNHLPSKHSLQQLIRRVWITLPLRSASGQTTLSGGCAGGAARMSGAFTRTLDMLGLGSGARPEVAGQLARSKDHDMLQRQVRCCFVSLQKSRAENCSRQC